MKERNLCNSTDHIRHHKSAGEFLSGEIIYLHEPTATTISTETSNFDRQIISSQRQPTEAPPTLAGCLGDNPSFWCFIIRHQIGRHVFRPMVDTYEPVTTAELGTSIGFYAARFPTHQPHLFPKH